MRQDRSLPSQRPSKIRLKLRTPDGAWNLTVSVGIERFIGPYSLVPGLASDSPLLEYQAIG